MENVKNLKSHDKGNTWKIIREQIESRNYLLFSAIIDARFWVPQHRERIYIVCFNKKYFNGLDFNFPKSHGKNIYLKSILEKKPDPKYVLSDKLWAYLQAYAKKHKAKGNGFGYGLNTPNDVSRTLSARYYKDGSEILIKQNESENPRRLTPEEAMKLMGFTNRYARLFGHKKFNQVVSDTQAYKQLGNSVVPDVVEQIGDQIFKTISTYFLTKKTIR